MNTVWYLASLKRWRFLAGIDQNEFGQLRNTVQVVIFFYNQTNQSEVPEAVLAGIAFASGRFQRLIWAENAARSPVEMRIDHRKVQYDEYSMYILACRGVGGLVQCPSVRTATCILAILTFDTILFTRYV